jgi:phage N-6-adenine-methyltransferase
MNDALLSSERMDWNTPDNVLELVRACSNTGRIGYDPCTTDDNPCRAICYSRPVDNGLNTQWWGNGLVYVNSPYGRELPEWVAKATRESAEGSEIIMLVPARTDTRWWQEHIIFADAICLWRGRLKFKGAPSAAPFPSALAYWGPRVDVFCKVFGPHGWIVRQ